MLHGNEAVRVRARVRVFPRASCGVLPARVLLVASVLQAASSLTWTTPELLIEALIVARRCFSQALVRGEEEGA